MPGGLPKVAGEVRKAFREEGRPGVGFRLIGLGLDERKESSPGDPPSGFA